MSDFVIKNPRCPECGELADGTLEECPGKALLNIDEETGEADYAGETKMFWDGQTTMRDDEGKALLVCPEGHEWPMDEKAEEDDDGEEEA